MMQQQDQTLKYFRSVAQEWHDKSETQDYNVIQGRHNAVLDAIDRYASSLQTLRQAVDASDSDALKTCFTRAKALRDQYVDVENS